MIYRTIGGSDLRVSILGYGGWALGEDGWEGVDAAEALATLELALDRGINFFDTAPYYGKGRSEERLGNLLSGVRKEIVLATKCGLLWDDTGSVRKDISRDAILFDLEGSLKRLRTDYIDLYQIHWPDNRTGYEETFSTLNQLQRDGVIRHIGISNYNLAGLKKARNLSRVVSIQNRYNMLQREDEIELLPWCQEEGVSYIPYSPLAQGLLTGKYTPDYRMPAHNAREFNPLFSDRGLFLKSLKCVEELEGEPVQAALCFLLQRREIPSVIVGMTKREHLQSNLAAIQGVEE